MSLGVDDLYTQALTLPDESKESLAERLVAYLATHVDPAVEKAQLDLAKRRRDEVRSGNVAALDGESIMAEARRIVGT